MTYLLTQTNQKPITFSPHSPYPSPSPPPPSQPPTLTTFLPPETMSTDRSPPIKTEDLPSAHTLHRITRKDDPNPFTTKLRHPPPTSFTPASPAFPQISLQRNPIFPRSIQDVLKYIAENRVKESPRVNREFFKSTQLHPYFIKGFKMLQSREEDPFFGFKPQDPGDVNLLATASLRFAPPVWRTFNHANENGQKIIGSETNQIDVVEKKPLTVTLNIYPMDEESAASYRKVNISGVKQVQKPMRKMKSSKMVIHLNLFSDLPEAMGVKRKKKTVIRG